MTDQPTLTPEILPPQETPEIYGPVTEASEPVPAPQKTNSLESIKKFAPFIAIFFILLIILVVSTMVSTTTTQNEPQVTMTPTPTIESRLISSKTLSSFATESAFLQFDNTIESLPKIIQQAVLQDPTALPPVLDLPLGFSN